MADDFYAAMERVEQRLEIASMKDEEAIDGDVIKVQEYLAQLAQRRR